MTTGNLFLAALELLALGVAAYGWGGILVRGDAVPPDAIHLRIARTAMGMGIIAFLTLGAGFLGWLHIAFFLAVLLLGNILALPGLRSIRWRIPGEQIRLSWLAAATILFLAADFFYSLFPPTFYDSMLYHLAVPQYHLLHGRIVPWATNFNANLPLTVEMLYLFGLLGKTVFLPKMLSLASGIGILLILRSWYKEIFREGDGWLPALLFLSIPEVGFLASSSKTDIAAMLFLLLGVRLYCDSRRNDRLKPLVLSGLFWGLAVASKYIFAFYLAAFFVSILISREKPVKKRIASILIISMLALLPMLPWLAKNIHETGNPVYPYLGSIFHKTSESESGSAAEGSAAAASNFSRLINRNSGTSISRYLTFLLEIFTNPYKYGMTAVTGLTFLFFLPFLLLTRKKPVEIGLILTAILSLLVMAWFAKVPRYFLSSFLLLSLPVAASIERLSRKHPLLKWAVTGVLLLLTANNLILQIDLQERFSRAIAFVRNRVSGRFSGQNVKYLYLLPYYRAAEFINRRLEATDLILFLGEERTFYVQRPVLASSFNDLNPLFPILKKSPDAAAFRTELQDLGITHILFDPDGLERLARMSPSLYRMDETGKEKLHEFLSRFPVAYRDDRYTLFRIDSASAAERRSLRRPLSP